MILIYSPMSALNVVLLSTISTAAHVGAYLGMRSHRGFWGWGFTTRLSNVEKSDDRASLSILPGMQGRIWAGPGKILLLS